MKLYNTLTRKTEEFKPLDAGQVKMYSCGPTVYDHAHIGNLSAYIYADTLRRVLKASQLDVTQVMNYTDVDDKTIKRSQEAYPDIDPRDALNKLTNQYIDLFLEDIKKVGIDTDAIDFVKATDSVEDMKALIVELVSKKIAYIADDGIYLSIEAYRKAGKKYGQLLKISDSTTSEARIDNDEYDKESIHDFALWKKQKGNEPAWDLGIDGHNLKGRPGWHIECSAMSAKALGLPFDIHTGGIDLIFPHHENEIAQSTAVSDSDVMANYFVHSNHLLVDGKKMAKSANNFYTLQDIIDKGYDPLAFRLLVLQSHYRSESNFTWENLEAAQNRLKDLQSFADIKHQPNLKTWIVDEEHQTYEGMIGGQIREFSDDLDTPSALSFLSSYTGHIESNGYNQDHFQTLLDAMDNLYALQLSHRPDISNDQKSIIEKREQVRKSKDWSKSDEFRDELLEQGIGIRDTDHGPIWYRT